VFRALLVCGCGAWLVVLFYLFYILHLCGFLLFCVSLLLVVLLWWMCEFVVWVSSYSFVLLWHTRVGLDWYSFGCLFVFGCFWIFQVLHSVCPTSCLLFTCGCVVCCCCSLFLCRWCHLFCCRMICLLPVVDWRVVDFSCLLCASLLLFCFVLFVVLVFILVDGHGVVAFVGCVFVFVVHTLLLVLFYFTVCGWFGCLVFCVSWWTGMRSVFAGVEIC